MSSHATLQDIPTKGLLDYLILVELGVAFERELAASICRRRTRSLLRICTLHFLDKPTPKQLLFCGPLRRTFFCPPGVL